MPKDLFTAAAVGLACSAAQSSQKKRYEAIQREMKAHDLRTYSPATSRDYREMRERYPDEPLGYLYPNRMSTETWKQYFTKNQWFFRVQNPSSFGIYLFNDRDIMGWNPEWGNIYEEYHKWCDATGVPKERRHLSRFFANPPHVKTEKEIIAERQQKTAHEISSSLPILGWVLVALFILILLGGG